MPETPWMQLSSYKRISYPVYTLLKVLHSNGELTPEQSYFMAERKPVYELYKIANDPFQLDNLAGCMPELVAEFDSLLTTWQLSTNDFFEDPDQAFRTGI